MTMTTQRTRKKNPPKQRVKVMCVGIGAPLYPFATTLPAQPGFSITVSSHHKLQTGVGTRPANWDSDVRQMCFGILMLRFGCLCFGVDVNSGKINTPSIF